MPSLCPFTRALVEQLVVDFGPDPSSVLYAEQEDRLSVFLECLTLKAPEVLRTRAYVGTLVASRVVCLSLREEPGVRSLVRHVLSHLQWPDVLCGYVLPALGEEADRHVVTATAYQLAGRRTPSTRATLVAHEAERAHPLLDWFCALLRHAQLLLEGTNDDWAAFGQWFSALRVLGSVPWPELLDYTDLLLSLTEENHEAWRTATPREVTTYVEGKARARLTGY